MDKYRTISTEVDAVLFERWSDAVKIMSQTRAAYYVAQGYEHPMRRESEFDTNGHVKDSAPGYLVIHTPCGEQRVDVGDWIVRDNEGVYSLNDDMFKERFEKVED